MSKKFHYLVFVSPKSYIFIPKKNIKSIKGVTTKLYGHSYNITFTKDSKEKGRPYKVLKKT